jgi:SAM-dependent methyltransferase
MIDPATIQNDIYGRYTMLGRLLRAAFAGSSEEIGVLDVGSGPAAISAAFLGSRFRVVRSDTLETDDPGIVRLVPGQPLPFADGAFPAVVAMDVLEHVPADQRAAFIAECQRVAARVVVLACPIRSDPVEQAERQFRDMVHDLQGIDLPFLREHAEYGLPREAETAAAFDPAWTTLPAPNNPLAAWYAFNTLDYLYALDLPPPLKDRLNAAVNAGVPLLRPGVPHYRMFFASARHAADARAMQAVIAAATKEGEAAPAEAEAALLARCIHGLRNDLRAAGSALLADKDAYIAGLGGQMAALSSELAGAQARFASLSAMLADSQAQVAAAYATIGQRDAAIAQRDAAIAQRDAAMAQRDAALGQREARIAALAAELNRPSIPRRVARRLLALVR